MLDEEGESSLLKDCRERTGEKNPGKAGSLHRAPEMCREEQAGSKGRRRETHPQCNAKVWADLAQNLACFVAPTHRYMRFSLDYSEVNLNVVGYSS